MLIFLGLGLGRPVGYSTADLPQTETLAIVLIGVFIVFIFAPAFFLLEELKTSKNKSFKRLANIGFLVLIIGFISGSIGIISWC